MQADRGTSVQDSLQDYKNLPLPSLIDQIAARRPDRPFVSLPRGLSPRDGFQDFTFQEFARAIDRCALWIVERFGRSQTFETLAYIGPQDLRCQLLTLAAAKTGHKAQHFHPAISADSRLSLLQSTKCKVLLHSIPMLHVARELLVKKSFDTWAVPELSDWMIGEEVPTLEYTNTLREAYDQPFCVVHSSGTTGPPKAVVYTHGSFISNYSSYCKISPSEESRIVYSQFRGLRTLIAAPISIAAGLYQLLGCNIVYDYIVVLPPPYITMTPDILDSIHVHGGVQVTVVLPKVLEDLSQSSSKLENLRHLRYLAFMGAPCPQYLGKILTSRTRLVSIFGSTESGVYPLDIIHPDDWEYLKFNAAFPHEFRSVCDGLYELVVTRNDSVDAFQVVFGIFPELHEYRTQDLFAKHPVKPGVWKFRGRMDDLVVSSFFGTFLPKSMEAIVESYPSVIAALIYGWGDKLFLVIEVKDCIEPGNQMEQLLEDIWPLVEEANRICPIGARIQRPLTICTDSRNPLPRGAKGYPQRKAVLAWCRDRMDNLSSEI